MTLRWNRRHRDHQQQQHQHQQQQQDATLESAGITRSTTVLGNGLASTTFAGTASNRGHVAIKVEVDPPASPYVYPDHALALREHMFYTLLTGTDVTPPLVFAGLESPSSTRRCLVTARAGSTLRSLPAGDKTAQRLRRIAANGIRKLGSMHANGVVHGDISPDNVVVTKTDQEEDVEDVRLIDFDRALAAKEWHGRSLIGHVTYQSIHTHRGHDAQPSDDVEMFMYTLVEICAGKLPWSNVADPQAVLEAKLRTPLKELCKKVPEGVEQSLRYLRALALDEHVDYDHLVRLFSTTTQAVDQSAHKLQERIQQLERMHGIATEQASRSARENITLTGAMQVLRQQLEAAKQAKRDQDGELERLRGESQNQSRRFNEIMHDRQKLTSELRALQNRGKPANEKSARPPQPNRSEPPPRQSNSVRGGAPAPRSTPSTPSSSRPDANVIGQLRQSLAPIVTNNPAYASGQTLADVLDVGPVSSWAATSDDSANSSRRPSVADLPSPPPPQAAQVSASAHSINSENFATPTAASTSDISL
ncbi:hypothetical protein RI367_005006 [Sorochytrium milnesiophthora]